MSARVEKEAPNMEQRDDEKIAKCNRYDKGKVGKLINKRKIRIAYLSGPCDAPAVYREWREHGRQNYFGTDFMKQFLQLAEDLDAESYIITSRSGECNERQYG